MLDWLRRGYEAIRGLIARLSQRPLWEPPDAASFAEPARAGAIRLVFEYEGDDVRLLASQRVDMRASLSESLAKFEGQPGYWAELRGDDRSVIYRQAVRELAESSIELFSNDPELAISRVPGRRPRGAFHVLLPDVDGAQEVALVRGDTDRATLRTTATEILRVPLSPAS